MDVVRVVGAIGINLALVLGLGPMVLAEEGVEELRQRGATIYRQSCADCHGEQGQGVESAYEEPLVGDESVGQLAQLIADTMPEGSPEDCEAEDAKAVAEFIHYAFYSEAAQIRNRPPRISLARLTANQLRQSIADLYECFDTPAQPTDKHGARGIYFDGDRWKDSHRKIERIDSVIDFDFGRESPGDGIKPEAFYIHWDGGILAQESGRYEIIVRSTCSFVMNLGQKDREFIDNHVQSGDKTEFRRNITLTAGRVYPFQIDFIQRKRKTELPPARISLSWIPPGGVEQIIPERFLVADRSPPTYSLQTVLPPDDRSYGYERGIAVNTEWDESTTSAALEFAQIAFEELWPAYRRRHRGDDADRKQLRDFLAKLVETAFRRPLTEELRQVFVDRQVDLEPDDAEAIKRVLLVSLKSPRFLYPAADLELSASLQSANRLTLVLFDSLPTDERLLQEARQGRMADEQALRTYARKHVGDYRVRAKTRELLHSWLNLSHFGEITKDEERYPGFDRELVADMRSSLDALLDDVVWSEQSDFRQLFLSKKHFTTERLAKYFADSAWQPAEEGHGLRSTAESDKHFGVLTHPYLLSGLAYHDSTSPIHRGVFLIRYMLGRTLRPPVEAFTPLSPNLHPDLTTRERVDLQTSPESCQLCHSKINGLGFTLENYDAVGRFRDMEQEKPINSAGLYTTRGGDEVKFSGPRELAQFLAHSEDAHRAFVTRAFQHFVKQPPAAYGADTLEKLTTKFRESDFNIRELIVEIAVTAAQPAGQPAPEHVGTR